MDWRLIPGVSFIVVQGGHVVRAGVYGLADIDAGRPVTPETVFHLGSVGKPFTASAIERLAAAGQLRLDDPISTYVPGSPPAWRPITIRHLLAHRSGLQDYDDGLDRAREYTDAELVAIVASQPLAFTPGQRFRYSNAGYLLLGMIVQRVSGTHLGDALARDVFRPLDMRATGMLGRMESPPRELAAGYRLADGKRERAPAVSRSLNSTGDGSVVSTAGDVARWLSALESSPDDALGWTIDTFRRHRILEKGGSWQGFATHVVRYPGARVSVAVMTNLTGIGNTAGLMAHKIARYFVPALRAAEWTPHPDVHVAAARLARYVGEYKLGDAPFRIVKDGDTLVVVAPPRRGRAVLIPTSQSEFRIEADSMRLRFADTPSGVVLYVRETTERRATRLR